MKNLAIPMALAFTTTSIIKAKTPDGKELEIPKGTIIPFPEDTELAVDESTNLVIYGGYVPAPPKVTPAKDGTKYTSHRLVNTRMPKTPTGQPKAIVSSRYMKFRGEIGVEAAAKINQGASVVVAGELNTDRIENASGDTTYLDNCLGHRLCILREAKPSDPAAEAKAPAAKPKAKKAKATPAPEDAPKTTVEDVTASLVKGAPTAG